MLSRFFVSFFPDPDPPLFSSLHRYILVYPQGCDVCNHLSLFLCVADYDKLLPGEFGEESRGGGGVGRAAAAAAAATRWGGLGPSPGAAHAPRPANRRA